MQLTGRKTRLGYYMYTPMLGGAETHLKDLLWNVDRDRFEVTCFTNRGRTLKSSWNYSSVLRSNYGPSM